MTAETSEAMQAYFRATATLTSRVVVVVVVATEISAVMADSMTSTIR